MKIRNFLVEEWMNAYEMQARFNIAETCVNSISLDELFKMSGTDGNAFWKEFCSRRMTYGDIEGYDEFKKGICSLYRTIRPEQVVPCHGAAGANHHIFYSLLEPGDRVITMMPTYQQLYSIPESFGAEVVPLFLGKDGSLPNLETLRSLVTENTRMICINNPNNPTGALMDTNYLKAVVEIARDAGAYLLCDEVYRHLTQEDSWSESVADLYEKGISISSMSKVFSLAGLRLGWIATRDEAVIRACLSHRDYNLISCGQLDERIAAIALANKDRLLERNRGIVRKNLAILDEWIQNEPHMRYNKPQAGTTALLYYDLPMKSYTFCRKLLEETGALLTPGDCFDMPGCVRIGYASDEESLRLGLAALSRFMKDHEADKAKE